MTTWRKLGIIAGAGALPLQIAEARASAGESVYFVRLRGAGVEGPSHFPGDTAGVGEAGKIIDALRRADCDAVCLAGVFKRPDFSDLKLDRRGAALLPKILAAAAKGDDAILKVLVGALEKEGFAVVGADAAADGLVAEAGAYGALAPGPNDFNDMRKAAALIDALGPFDVGQGAVVAGGHVLAVEAAEGTDAMLTRCRDLQAGAARAGVLVKRPKPGQELRVDLPVIGPQTIRKAGEAGLAGVAVEAGRALVIARDEARALADDHGLFLYGLTRDDLAAQ